MERVAIYPGTFDPITFGHLDIIKRSLVVVDKLVVTVANNTSKNTIFNLKKRTELVKRCLNELGENERNRIEVVPFKGLIVDFMKSKNANIVIRGLRTASDFEYEFQMAGMNHAINPEIETILLPTFASKQFISSTLVKEIAKLGGDISPFVPECSRAEVEEFYRS